jgi:3-oxoacyl-[acyl-carrier-protein] synthase II
MLYIHQTSCISPQAPYSQSGDGSTAVGIAVPRGPVDNLLRAVEPSYEGIPGSILRRMSKSVKMGVGAALPLLPSAPSGILIGTGNGGTEDSVKFLKQIIDYNEGLLTPGAFVQSTANAIASQIGLLHHNNGYNTTYVHRGLAFESALIDTAMLVNEHPGHSYLAGGVDEISAHHHRFDYMEGWYKKEDMTGKDLYTTHSPGSIAGEGSAMFVLSGTPVNALAEVKGIATLRSEDHAGVKAAIEAFLHRHLPVGVFPDLLLSGENGDSRGVKGYELCEDMMAPDTTIARFKHLCGEYPTASAYALWLACNLPLVLPEHFVKRQSKERPYKTILIYNQYEFSQHSLILLERSL